jgi:hypothetical protein
MRFGRLDDGVMEFSAPAEDLHGTEADDHIGAEEAPHRDRHARRQSG